MTRAERMKAKAAATQTLLQLGLCALQLQINSAEAEALSAQMTALTCHEELAAEANEMVEVMVAEAKRLKGILSAALDNIPDLQEVN